MNPVHKISFLIFLFLLGCGKDYVTGKSSYNLFSLQTDMQLGQEVLKTQIEEFKKKKVLIDSPRNQENLQAIRQIVHRLAEVSHLPQLPYEAHLADAPIVNAWAAPGGKIMVYEGLWDTEKGLIRSESPEELAAVLGHEIAHCTARHVTKALSRYATFTVIGAIASSAIAGAGSAQGADLFEAFFNQGMNIYIPTYSRKNEAEADRLGMFYMAKAGFDPRAAVEVWKRAATKRGDKTSIFASHPASGERAKRLEKYLPEALKIYEANRQTTFPPFQGERL